MIHATEDYYVCLGIVGILLLLMPVLVATLASVWAHFYYRGHDAYRRQAWLIVIWGLTVIALFFFTWLLALSHIPVLLIVVYGLVALIDSIATGLGMTGAARGRVGWWVAMKRREFMSLPFDWY